jgi:hypothetical protein
MSRKLAIAVVWFSAALAVLAWASTRFQYSDLDMVFFPVMLVLTFPAGLVGAFVGLVIYLPFAYILNLPPGGAFFYFVAWLAMVVAGYWQWFVWVPRVLTKRRHA